MLADPERFVRRLVARLKVSAGLSTLHAGRKTISVTVLEVASIPMPAFAPRAVAPAHPAIHPP
jgi:hypothetical protein